MRQIITESRATGTSPERTAIATSDLGKCVYERALKPLQHWREKLDSHKQQFLRCVKGYTEWHKEILQRGEAYQKSIDVVEQLLVKERVAAARSPAQHEAAYCWGTRVG